MDQSLAWIELIRQIYYKNQTGYQIIDWGYDINLADCYVIQMKLDYSEIYAPMAAFFVQFDRLVVLDRELTPVLIGANSGMAVA